MMPEQKQRLRYASFCPTPISATCPPDAAKQWAKARRDVINALKGRNLRDGLSGCVYIESCCAMDHYLVRTPTKAAGSAQ